MAEAATTAEHIMETFLRLVAERGLAATTTRALADAAGVNEVTIFRHFKDKGSLIHAVFEHFALDQHIATYTPTIDTTTPERAAEGLLRCLVFLRDTLREHIALLQFGIGEYWKFPTIREESASAPRAAQALMERALREARPMLGAEVDISAATLSLLGLILLTVLWQGSGWLTVSPVEWDETLAAAIRPLIAWERGTLEGKS